MTVTTRQLLQHAAYRRIDVEHLLDPQSHSWIRFDPELGYVPNDTVMLDGMDWAKATYRHGRWGERMMFNWADQPCRVNTYGDSFTQCQQVSDDETWQERLAAHIGEPLRNFGSGGYGIYQAYWRARRMEEQGCAAEHVVLNIFDDDHIRSLDAARWVRTAWHDKDRPADRAYPLHGLPWVHLRYDLAKGAFVHHDGLCRSEAELLELTDKERFYETFRDDAITRLFALTLGGEADCADLEQVAEALGVKVDLRNEATRQAQARKLHLHYGWKSTEHLLAEMTAWATEKGKKLLILLSYSMGSVGTRISGGPRFDEPFVEYLKGTGIPFVDTLESHCRDYKQFKVTPEEYLARYYILAAGAAVFGHYSPPGNMFFAYAVKNDIVNWLDPKPSAYRK